MDWRSMELCLLGRTAWSPVESFIALLPPPRALQDSMWDLHNQVNACLDRFELKGHLPLLAWMSAVFCLPSIHLPSSGSCILPFFLHSRPQWGGVMGDTWPRSGQSVSFSPWQSFISGWVLDLDQPKETPLGTFVRKISVAQLLGYTVEMPQLCSLSSITGVLAENKAHQWCRPCVQAYTYRHGGIWWQGWYSESCCATAGIRLCILHLCAN